VCAQTPQSLISGTVLDAEIRDGLADVQVLLIGAGGNELMQAVTDSLGHYRFLAVTHQLRAEVSEVRVSDLRRWACSQRKHLHQLSQARARATRR